MAETQGEISSRQPKSEASPVYEELKPIALNGSVIKFLGVTHSKSLLPQMAGKIEGITAWADIVLSESIPFESPILQRVNEIIPMDADISGFFNHILNLCRENKKTIGAVDPTGMKFTVWQSVLEYSMLSSGVKLAKEPVRRALRKPSLTRREFLKAMAIGATATYLGGRQSFTGLVVRGILDPRIKEHYYDYSAEDQLIADTKNYRDMMAATNIIRLSELLKDSGGRKVASIAGMAHQRIVREYTLGDHSLEQKIKTPISVLHGLFGENNIRIYSHNGKSWIKDPDIS